MKGTFFIATAAALFVFAGTAHAAGDPQAGKAKAGACVGCHGANGEGKNPYPALAGKSEASLLEAMKDYKSGKRNNAVMKGFVANLSDEDMANLAAYYSSLKAK